MSNFIVVPLNLLSLYDIPKENPYLVIQLDGEEFAETSKKIQTTKPIWNEAFSGRVNLGSKLDLYVCSEPDCSNEIQILGTASLLIATLQSKLVHYLELALNPNGSVNLELVLVPDLHSLTSTKGKYKLLDQATNHQFTTAETVHQPIICSLCSTFIWRNANKCSLCSMVAHSKCVPNILNTCRRVTEFHNISPKSRLHLNVEHIFAIKTFLVPTFCSHCGQLLVGLVKQGFHCRQCGVAVHDLCRALAAKNCQSLENRLAETLKNIAMDSSIGRRKLSGWKSFREIKSEVRVKLTDLRFDRKLGSGNNGSIFLAENIGSGKFFAVKVVSKVDTVKNDMTELVMSEKYVLSMGTKNNFINRLFATFQNLEKMYFMMEYHPKGDLFYHLKRVGKFNSHQVWCYSSELCVGIHFLHSRGTIHRDLKLENILLDADGHIKISGFELSKVSDRASTCCGTPSFLAPEVIFGRQYSLNVDWWSCGIAIFQMLAGYSPFSGANQAILFKNILQHPVEFPFWFTKEEKDLLESMMKKDPSERFGGFVLLEELNENFSYFKSNNWDIVRNRRLLMPVFPDRIENQYDHDLQEWTQDFDGEIIFNKKYFKGFSFYNDYFDFEDDLSKI